MAGTQADRPNPTWLERVRAAMESWRDSGVVVAVSGGGDSVGLLRVLHRLAPELGLKLSVAHLNHGVRVEAAEDARFVANLAEVLGLPMDQGLWHPERPGHFEADARRARYAWLVEVARDRGAVAVAVGHSRDDQVETILHRIVRGTGLRGLAGMPARRRLAEGVELIRPLLDVSREEIRKHLAAIGQAFREDATNADLSRTRSRLRHDLLPRLATDYNPRVDEALLRLGRFAEEAGRRLDRRIDRLERRAVIEAGPEVVCLLVGPLRERSATTRAELFRRLWRKAGWPELGMDARRWLRLAGLVGRDRGRFSIGGGVDVWLSADILRLSPVRASAEDRPLPTVSFPVPGSARWGSGRISATVEDLACDEAIDFDRLDPIRTADGRPFLCIKGPADGDRFEPLGMGGRGMPLNDFLRGRGVPREHRREIPLVYDRSGIFWVVGHRIADRVRRTETTTRVLGMRWDAGCD